MGDLIYNYGAQRFREEEATTHSNQIQERRQLKKLWRKASKEEKEGIDVLQVELKDRLSSLKGAKKQRRKRTVTVQVRSAFKDPFTFVKSLYTEVRGGKFLTTKNDLEAHLGEALSDSQQWVSI
ncbi:hypothetical protein JOB18_034170 [Solea senegalensis]|uniref:Uncharacterized protein n=1 Tax=Solea senegalensis TaxID=28829 RepID=A0AAV6QGW8_SOLSE|nr:hypothetical protein JOB18_034170 [Solea senegalensis]